MRRLASTWNCRQGALSGATCSFYLGGATQAAWQCHTKHRAALEGPQSPINRSHPLKPQFCLRCIFEWLVACVEQFICSHVKTRRACEVPTVKGIQLSTLLPSSHSSPTFCKFPQIQFFVQHINSTRYVEKVSKWSNKFKSPSIQIGPLSLLKKSTFSLY